MPCGTMLYCVVGMRYLPFVSLIVVLLVTPSCKHRTVEEGKRDLAPLLVNPTPCSRDSDCCTVSDFCRAETYVVSAKNARKARSILDSIDRRGCAKCAPAIVDVSCGPAGVCVATQVPYPCSTKIPEVGDHCGKLDLPPDCIRKASGLGLSDLEARTRDALQRVEQRPPAAKQKLIFGCGP
jgi:hypothetical protein